MDIKKSWGGALLTALFIMTLVAIVATAMSMRLQSDIYRTRIIIAHDKLYLATQAVNFWGLSELNNPKNLFSKLLAPGMVAKFPQNMSNVIPGIQLSGELYDLQTKFNINSMTDIQQRMIFINLLKNQLPQVNRIDAINLVLTVQDWLSPYDPAHGKDDYLTYYLAQKPPYYPSHELMQNISEFRLLKDVSAKTYLSLEPFLTALPEVTPININTAPKKMLAALFNDSIETHVNELLQLRGDNGFTNPKDLAEAIEKTNIPQQLITTESQYFLCVAHAKMDEFSLVVYSLMKREKDKNKKITANIMYIARVSEA